MSTDTIVDPKVTASRFYELMNAWDASRLGEVFADDLRGHGGAGANLDELAANVGGFLAAFPDLRTEVKHLVREGDTVSTWVVYTGTHEGEFAGVPASGREIRIAGWDLFRVENDRIVEISQYCDLFTLMNQIGALPTATPA